MRWTNKIIQSNNQDQNTSRLSSRSLSKFKKINLQKSQAQISSNQHLQKSQLKLTSVQKIKPSHNRSFISNYITITNGGQCNVPQSSTANPQKPTFQLKTLHSNNHRNEILTTSNNHENLSDQHNDDKHKQPFQGLALYHKATSFQSITHQNPQKQLITSNHIPPQVQMQSILTKIHQLIQKFKSITSKIKLTFNHQSSLIRYQKIQTSLISFVDNFYTNLQNGIKTLISLKNNQQINITELQKQLKNSRLNGLQKILKNDINLSQKASQSESFYKIKYFQHQQIYHKEKQQTKNRPNCFKNKFKQLVVDSNQQNHLLIKNHIEKQQYIRQTFGQQNKRIQENGEQNKQTKSPHKKLSRKRTNPTPRINPLFQNQSTILNDNSLNQQHNASTNSIKYCKVNDRSASRSVKKLQQKITMIKNIFKSQITKSQNQHQLITKI